MGKDYKICKDEWRKNLGQPIYLGRDQEGQAKSRIVEPLSVENKNNAEKSCKKKVNKYIENISTYGVVRVLEETSSSFDRYKKIYNCSSFEKVAEMLGYEKKVFTETYVNYSIYSKERTEKVDTGKFSITYDHYSGAATGVESEKKERKYFEYFYQEEERQVAIELWLKLNKKEDARVEEKEKKFIAEHDYYLARKHPPKKAGIKVDIFFVYLFIALSIFSACLCVLSACYTTGKGGFDGWNDHDMMDRKYILNFLPFLKNILGPNALLLMLVFYGLHVILGTMSFIVLIIIRKKNYSEDLLEGLKPTIKKIFWITFSVVTLIAITSLQSQIDKYNRGEGLVYVLEGLGAILFLIFSNIINFLFIRILTIIITFGLTIYLLVGVCTCGFGMGKAITKSIEKYCEEIDKREKNGTFNKMDKLIKEIKKATIPIPKIYN